MANKLRHHLLIHHSTTHAYRHNTPALLKPNWTIVLNASLLAIFQDGNSTSQIAIMIHRSAPAAALFHSDRN
jgi:hypothetical protein